MKFNNLYDFNVYFTLRKDPVRRVQPLHVYRMPEHLQLYVQRIPRDQAFIDAMEAEIVVFLREVNATVAKLKGVK